MPIDSISVPSLSVGSGSAPCTTGQSQKDSPEKIAKAASDFEALLLGQLLKSAREAGGTGWMGTEDSTGSTLSELAEQSLSAALSQQGGLGLAKMIRVGLEKKPSSSSP